MTEIDPDSFNLKNGVLTRYGKKISMTKRQKIVTTLITDKILRVAYFNGAHVSHNWMSGDLGNDNSVFSRMSKICYSQCFHVKRLNTLVAQKRQKLLPNMKFKHTVFNHIVYCSWKEPFGHGKDLPQSKSTDPAEIKNEKTGKWHKIWDLGLEIVLWHPSQQSKRETLIGANGRICRPIYDFSKEEVVKSLQFLCEVFKLKFEEGENTAARFVF